MSSTVTNSTNTLDIIEYLKSQISNLDNKEKLIEVCRSKSILVKVQSLEEENKMTRNKVACLTSLEKINFKNKMEIECNGLIVDNKLNPLMVPPYKIARRFYNKTAVNKSIYNKEYDIFHAVDGTLIHFYHFENEWYMSSTNSYDCANIKFDKEYTFKHMFVDALNENKITYKDFLDTLNSKFSYSFLVSHHLLQYLCDKPTIYMIQSVKLDTLERFEIPHKVNENYTIPTQKKINAPNIDFIQKLAGNAINDYVENKYISYGYILRAKNGASCYDTNLADSNLCIDSSLKAFLNNAFYQHYFIKSCLEKKYDKSKALVAYNLLNTKPLKFSKNGLTHDKLFKNIYNKASEDFLSFNKTLDHIVNVYKSDSTDDPECSKLIHKLTLHFPDSADKVSDFKNQIVITRNFEPIMEYWMFNRISKKVV